MNEVPESVTVFCTLCGDLFIARVAEDLPAHVRVCVPDGEEHVPPKGVDIVARRAEKIT